MQLLVDAQDARLKVACDHATETIYSKADELLASRPDLEAQFEQEIKENRWNLMAVEE